MSRKKKTEVNNNRETMKRSVQMIGIPRGQNRENNEEEMFKEIKQENCQPKGRSFQMEKAQQVPAQPQFQSSTPRCIVRKSESMQKKGNQASWGLWGGGEGTTHVKI